MVPDILGELGSFVGVWAHPDDEAYLAAGLMVRAVDAGHRVVCVTATRGEQGFPDDDGRSVHERMRIRETELTECLGILGVSEHRFLGYGDGRCAEVPDDVAAVTLAALIDDVRPDHVLTFGPDGATGHPDHIAVCRWTTRAVELTRCSPVLLYATKSRRWRDEFFAGADLSSVMMVEGLEIEAVEESDLAVWLTCDDALLSRKIAALRAQRSQIEPMVEMMGSDRFADLAREEFFRRPVRGDAAAIARARTLGTI